jgi:phosphatidate cytidylyltransferase
VGKGTTLLKTRIVTALLLMAVFLPSLFLLPQRLWAVLGAAIITAAAWEWAALIGLRASGRLAYAAFMMGICVLFLIVFPDLLGAANPASFAPAPARWVYAVATLFWLLAVPAWFACKWSAQSLPLGGTVGLLVLFPAWLAFVQLRFLGPWTLLAILALAWVADIAAYAAGRNFGRHKLAPTISPGKTWEGAVGALIGVTVYGFTVQPLFFDLVASKLHLAAALLLITAVSIVGDLFESLLKRQAGLKDSSNILPGHGGILDRVDSLTSTLPLVALIWLS